MRSQRSQGYLSGDEVDGIKFFDGKGKFYSLKGLDTIAPPSLLESDI
jgi:biotin operon repressor